LKNQFGVPNTADFDEYRDILSKPLAQDFESRKENVAPPTDQTQQIKNHQDRATIPTIKQVNIKSVAKITQPHQNSNSTSLLPH
jgi:hypothetical protein